jgi:hypothetical protein
MRIELAPRDVASGYSALSHAVFDHDARAAAFDTSTAARPQGGRIGS